MKIAPSLLSADFAEIAGAIAAIEAGGADLVHLDVMDGRFVPNLTWGPKVIGDLRRLTKLPFDVHLMIEEPERYVEAFREAGADGITIHVEAGPHSQRTLTQIRSLGAKPGLAICPGTPVAWISDLMYDVDLLLIMSVNPGFGGQTFLPHSLERIRQARALIEERNPGCALEVDGGVGAENIAAVVTAGADTVVMGSSIFGTRDPVATIKRLRALAERETVGAN